MYLRILLVIAAVLIGAVAFYFFFQRGQFDLPSGEATPLEETPFPEDAISQTDESVVAGREEPAASSREIFVTGGIKHSISLDEILAGGPPKDGIPSIDNPKFVSAGDADGFLDDDEAGLGFVWKGTARFYPYQILVYHEIVNDVVAGDPILVSYCPLCLTGIVFERRVAGEQQEFGVSGKLWRSNLLMYNRAPDPDDESLWSQVLGEAVFGTHTGARLAILSSDTVRYGDWKKKYPDTEVLSRDTGSTRLYGSDPYGSYYTSREVGFGANFDDSDARLHPKQYVLGVEIDGKYKAYDNEALPEGVTVDTFAGREITITKSVIGEVRMEAAPQDGSGEKEPLPHIGSFWFSWLAVHPDTELYKQ